MSFADDCAGSAIDEAINRSGDRASTLKSVIRVAGNMLAESHGHDIASATFAPLARQHAEKAARAGVTFGRQRR